jgi:ubiquinone/menaquinone biosynthesis C-methylase UbiE
MPRDIDEQALFDRFSDKYKVTESGLLKQIERSNCGCDYGATSFATLDQVRKLAAMLKLEPKKKLLEVGAGSGWPGLYLSKTTGCDVTLTDVPLEGLQIAKRRAIEEGLSQTSSTTVASGAALPFPDNWFHAISHSDVLCCLVDKIGVLKACRAVVREDGVMIFSVILISPDLSERDYARALENGPSFIATDESYQNLLEQAGWELVDRTNLTPQFGETLQVMLENELSNADGLERLLGKQETEQRLLRSHSYIDATEHGLIRREMFHVVPAKVGD